MLLPAEPVAYLLGDAEEVADITVLELRFLLFAPLGIPQAEPDAVLDAVRDQTRPGGERVIAGGRDRYTRAGDGEHVPHRNPLP